jgi:hypothetical protein
MTTVRSSIRRSVYWQIVNARVRSCSGNGASQLSTAGKRDDDSGSTGEGRAPSPRGCEKVTRYGWVAAAAVKPSAEGRGPLDGLVCHVPFQTRLGHIRPDDVGGGQPQRAMPRRPGESCHARPRTSLYLHSRCSLLIVAPIIHLLAKRRQLKDVCHAIAAAPPRKRAFEPPSWLRLGLPSDENALPIFEAEPRPLDLFPPRPTCG